MALEAIENSINYYATGKRTLGKQLIMPVNNTLKIMKKAGFVNLKWDGDGLINSKKK